MVKNSIIPQIISIIILLNVLLEYKLVCNEKVVYIPVDNKNNPKRL